MQVLYHGHLRSIQELWETMRMIHTDMDAVWFFLLMRRIRRHCLNVRKYLCSSYSTITQIVYISHIHASLSSLQPRAFSCDWKGNVYIIVALSRIVVWIMYMNYETNNISSPSSIWSAQNSKAQVPHNSLQSMTSPMTVTMKRQANSATAKVQVEQLWLGRNERCWIVVPRKIQHIHWTEVRMQLLTFSLAWWCW